MLINVNKLKKK